MRRAGISSDFSLQGMFIRTNYPKAPDTVLEITLYLPQGLTSRLRVKVKRAWKTPTGKVIKAPTKTGKNGMGVEILERDANYLHFIRYLVCRSSALKEVPPEPIMAEV